MLTEEQKQETMRVLRQHMRRYPAMEPTDAVKLLYQNEFAGGDVYKRQITISPVARIRPAFIKISLVVGSFLTSCSLNTSMKAIPPLI